MAIETLAYKIVADTRQFDPNIKATRREMSLAKRIMQETVTPAERLQDGLRGLESLYKKGLLPATDYRKAVDKLKTEVGGTATNAGKAATKLGQFLEKMTGRNLQTLGLFGAGAFAVQAGISAISGVANTAKNAIGGMLDQFRQLDREIKIAQGLEVEFNQFQALAIAADEAGISQEELTKSLQKMQESIGKAATDGGKLEELFTRLGFNLDALSEADAITSFLAISDELAKIESASIKSAVAQQIFGRQSRELTRLLGVGSKGFAEYAVEAEDALLTMNQDQLANVAATVDALGDLERQLKGLRRTGSQRVLGETVQDVAEISKLLQSTVGPPREGRIGATGLNFTFGAVGATQELLGSLGASAEQRNLARKESRSQELQLQTQRQILQTLKGQRVLVEEEDL